MFKQPAVILDKIKKASIVIVLYRNTKKEYKNHYFALRNMNIYISMYQDCSQDYASALSTYLLGNC